MNDHRKVGDAVELSASVGEVFGGQAGIEVAAKPISCAGL
jgi:hypothetical protein